MKREIISDHSTVPVPWDGITCKAPQTFPQWLAKRTPNRCFTWVRGTVPVAPPGHPQHSWKEAKPRVNAATHFISPSDKVLPKAGTG